jgi:dienelactone hydrolase
MTCFYSYQELLVAAHQPQTVEKDGEYAVWVWAQGGASARVSINDTWFKQTHDSKEWKLTWQEAGRIDLKAGQACRIQIQTGQILGGSEHGPRVGGLALTTDKGFDPNRNDEVSRVFNQSAEAVADQRLLETKGVHTPMTLRSYTDLATWEKRAAQIRQHILVCLGLWPLPQRKALKAKIFGRIVRDGYSVEKVFFESWPGFYVCGNLYRPLGKGPFSAVITPHGHWAEGRLVDNDLGSVPGRCINLARQGHVVFSYDMAGYVDSDQVAHRKFGGQHEDLWGLGLMGLQLWNSIRAVDFISSLKEVDVKRIGCTGASGGGTQAFMLTAVDDRIAAAAPVNMVSAHMQGGCICENQSHLRLDINNVEIASLMAPKPMLMVATTGDWTVHTPEVEYPAVRQVYQLYGAEDRLSTHQEDAPHNYNKGSREAVYQFFARWFLKSKTPHKYREQDFQVEREEDLRVFHQRPKPKDATDAAGVTQRWIEERQKALTALAPKDKAGLKTYNQTMGPALAHALDVEYPSVDDLYIRDHGQTRRQGYLVQRLELGRVKEGERLPALLFVPRPKPKKMPATLIVHPQGKVALTDLHQGDPGKEVSDLMAAGHMVLAIDPFGRGEFKPVFGECKRPHGDRLFATYNRTDTACRVQDILTALAYLQQRHDVTARHLLGLEAAGIWCLLARALSPDVNRTAIDFDRFKANDDGTWVAQHFVPAIRSAGDFKTALALAAPGHLLVHQAGAQFPMAWAKKCYRLVGKERQLALQAGKASWTDILAWLTK